jgi:hypothetical protein
MRYTAWGRAGKADTLVEGDGPPRFADGTLIDPGAEVVATLQADIWEEAMRQYHELQGWGPYRPAEGRG